MCYELQLIGDIPIIYLRAIGLDYSSYDVHYYINELRKVNEMIKENKLFGHPGKKYYNLCRESGFRESSPKFENDTDLFDYICWLKDLETASIHEVVESQTLHLRKVTNLLRKHDLYIPIVDLNYGYVLPDIEEIEHKTKKFVKKIEKYRQNN